MKSFLQVTGENRQPVLILAVALAAIFATSGAAHAVMSYQFVGTGNGAARLTGMTSTHPAVLLPSAPSTRAAVRGESSQAGGMSTRSTGNFAFTPQRVATAGPADGAFGPVAGLYNLSDSQPHHAGRHTAVAKVIPIGSEIPSTTGLAVSTGAISYGLPGAASTKGISPVPEPKTVFVFGLGLLGACFLHARRAKLTINNLA